MFSSWESGCNREWVLIRQRWVEVWMDPQTVNFLVFLLGEIGSGGAHCECVRRFASFVGCFLQDLSIDTFRRGTDKYSVHFQEMPGFKGKRKRGLTVTLYKKQFRYRLPVSPASPPRKRTKTSSSTTNLKSPSIRTLSLLNKSLSISKYLYPFKRVSTLNRR